MRRPSVIVAGTILALVFSAAACDYSSPAAPDADMSAPGPEGAAISITSSGLSPNAVTITAGQSVTFTNNDSAAHEIVSAPVPTYDDCPAINRISRLDPGESVQTGALSESRSCGFLDLLSIDDARWQGTIVVQ